MRPKDRARLRVIACACVLAVLLAAALPASAGMSQAVLAPVAPILSEPAAAGVLPGTEETSPPERFVVRVGAARAPPLA